MPTERDLVVVCHCHRVSDAHVENVLDAGAPGLRDVVRATKAGTGCGSCLPQLRTLCERARRDEVAGVGAFGVAPAVEMELAG